MDVKNQKCVQDKMMLTIGIVNYYTEDYIIKCLKSIYRDDIKYPFTIYIVDNGSEKGKIIELKKRFPDIKLIRNLKNVGFSRACNQIYFRSKSKYILYLNPDTEVEKNAINSLLDFMEKHSDAGAAGAKLLKVDGKLQLSCRRFPTLWNVFFGRQSIITKYLPYNRFTRSYMLSELDYTKTQQVDWVVGAAVIIRRTAIENIEGFDERFFLYVEDVDLCYRFANKGWKVYYVPDAIIKHHLGVSTKKIMWKARYYHNVGMYRYFLKHNRPNKILYVVLGLGLIYRLSFLIFTGEFIKRLKV